MKKHHLAVLRQCVDNIGALAQELDVNIVVFSGQGTITPRICRALQELLIKFDIILDNLKEVTFSASNSNLYLAQDILKKSKEYLQRYTTVCMDPSNNSQYELRSEITKQLHGFVECMKKLLQECAPYYKLNN